MSEGFDSLLFVLAIGLGAGLSPVGPGTVGSALGLVVAWPLSRLQPAWHALVILLLGGFGVWLCGAVAQRLGEKDPGMIVFDEIVGLLVAVYRLPWQWRWIMPAFLLYRLFDILKPWPVSGAEQWFGLGGSIMADDAIAGLLTLGVMWGVNRFLKGRS